MKKLISILIASLLMLQCVAFADYSLGTSEDEVVISGQANPFKMVSFVLLNNEAFTADSIDGIVDEYIADIEDGNILTTEKIFYFDAVRADANGDWQVIVDMAGIETKDLILFESEDKYEPVFFASVDYRAGILSNLIEKAFVEDDNASLKNAITTDISYIADSWDLYGKLTNKLFVANFVDDTIKTFDPITAGSAELAVLKAKMDKAILLQAISEGKMSNFDKAFYFDYDTSLKATMSSAGQTKTLELLKGGDYSVEDDYIAAAQEVLKLQNFNYNTNQNGNNLVEVLETLGLDLDDFDDLGNSDQAKAAKSLAKKKSEDYEEAQDNLDDIVEDILYGKGGSKGGFSDVSSLPFTPNPKESISDENIQGQKYIYTDSHLAPWSADAVVYLSDKSIVAGYEDGSFKPNNSITRAEFTKLVVEAFYGITAYEYTTAFSDVPQNAWYAPYVNKAYDNGIVAGTSAGKFNPNDTITREDMAVILYNAAIKHGLIATASPNKLFADEALISAYAKDAVYTLKALNIVSGVGTGEFEPKSNATRAAACQMLYSLMVKTSK